ncbi:MAG: methyltransferase [Saprospiraceae bacterium]|nr:methyltransferase [Saprospiraceae bacterium]
MSNPDTTGLLSKQFRFKQFSIHTTDRVFPVTTDSVLLGSWVGTSGVHKVLDLGCGSGILSLMIAQRTSDDCVVIALDHHAESIEIAMGNFMRSDWRHKLFALQLNVVNLIEKLGTDPFQKQSFQLIISNPPYFKKLKNSPTEMKSRARHQLDFDFEALARLASFYLAHEGNLAVVIPRDLEYKLTSVSSKYGLYLKRKCTVKHSSNSEPGLCLCEYGPHSSPFEFTELTLYENEHTKTPEFRALTQDFYL